MNLRARRWILGWTLIGSTCTYALSGCGGSSEGNGPFEGGTNDSSHAPDAATDTSPRAETGTESSVKDAPTTDSPGSDTNPADGGQDTEPPSDAPHDGVAKDTAPPPDGATDTGHDGGSDAGFDAGFDTGSPDVGIPDTTADLGVPDTGLVDSSLVCAPGSLAGFTPALNANAVSAGSCTTTMITNIVNDCLFGTSSACTKLLADAATSNCYTGCVYTDWTASPSQTSYASTPWGGFIYIENPGFSSLFNWGGCIAQADPSSLAAQKCGTDWEETLECAIQACAASCPVPTSGDASVADQTALFDCINAAYALPGDASAGGECASYNLALDTDCSALPVDSGVLNDCLDEMAVLDGEVDAGLSGVTAAYTQYLDILCTGAP